MTYVAADGPPDLDATHLWAPATGTAPPTLNNRTSPITFPWVKVENITGWRSAPEADDNREAKTVGAGEISYPGRLLGKTVVYECEVRATSRESLRSVLTGCLNGFGDRSGLGTMTVTPYTVPGGVAWQFQARVLSFEADPSFTFNGLYRWGFTLSLRMLDPYFYTPNLAGTAYL